MMTVAPHTRRERRGWRERTTREKGALSVFILMVSLVLFAVAGLALDGGRILNAKDQAADVAEQAARAAAGQIDVNGSPDPYGLRGPNVMPVIDATKADQAAKALATRDGYDYGNGTTPGLVLSADHARATVTVSKPCTTVLLGIVGVSSVTVTGTQTATAWVGMTGAQP